MARKPELTAANAEDRAQLELTFEQPYLLGPLFGDYDRHLVMIEDRLGVHIAARGNRVMIEGEADSAARARDVLVGLYNRLDRLAVDVVAVVEPVVEPDQHVAGARRRVGLALDLDAVAARRDVDAQPLLDLDQVPVIVSE